MCSSDLLARDFVQRTVIVPLAGADGASEASSAGWCSPMCPEVARVPRTRLFAPLTPELAQALAGYPALLRQALALRPGMGTVLLVVNLLPLLK